MAKRTRKAEAERDAWRVRRPWPTAVLGIDPGTSVAGAALVLPSLSGEEPELCWARTINPYTTSLELALEDSVSAAQARNLGLVLVLEEWGTGGPMGIKTWLGLGAARGHWIRAAHMLCEKYPGLLVASRLYVYAHMQTWRSWMDVPAIVVDENGATVRRNDPEDWKRFATARLAELAPHIQVESADAAEAALIALFGSRFDAVGARIPIRVLKEHGMVRPAT